MNRLLPLLLLLLLTASTAAAQSTDTIRVCTWNVLNYTGIADSLRSYAMRPVLRAIQPHIIVAPGMIGIIGGTWFSQFVLRATGIRTWVGTTLEGPDTDICAYWDSTKVRYLYYQVIPTDLRDINEFVLTIKANGDTLHLFVCNLKNGDTGADSSQRAAEAALIRQRTDTIPRTHHFILAGDLNTYTSTEGAYERLTYLSRTLPGHFADPIDSYGKWHSDSTFTYLHTQSTRVREFGGGVGGGLNDRFNFVLLSQGLMNDNYIPGSYTTFGNDGQHFHDSINALPNRAVPDSIAQALYVASDHLPVYLDLVFPSRVSGVEEEKEKPGSMDLTERRE